MSYPVGTIREIAKRHNIHGEPELLPAGGMVNEAWRIGEHILRICNDAEGKDEAEREAAVVPIVIQGGLKAPRLVAFDLKSDLVPLPYTIYERASGVLLGYCDFEPTKLSETYREIGREIARLVRIPVSDELKPKLRDGRGLETWKILAKAMSHEVLCASDGKEIGKWLECIEPKLGKPKREALIHMDMHPWNLFVDSEMDELTAIIDWGDASWGDPAMEFASMPLVAVPFMFEGYLEEGGEMDEGFIARALQCGVSLALWEIRELPVAEFGRQWWRMPPGGWTEMRELIGKYWPEYSLP